MDVYYFPPATRTVLLSDDCLARWDHPGLVFIPIFAFAAFGLAPRPRRLLFNSMWVAGVDRPPTHALDNVDIWHLGFDNIGCLGKRAKALVNQGMSPVDAFWNTSFRLTQVTWADRLQFLASSGARSHRIFGTLGRVLRGYTRE